VASLIMASAGALEERLYANDEATVTGNVVKLTGVARVSTDGKESQALNFGDSLNSGIRLWCRGHPLEQCAFRFSENEPRWV